ncbi:hypothetical protein [Streptomyces spororaveus]
MLSVRGEDRIVQILEWQWGLMQRMLKRSVSVLASLGVMLGGVIAMAPTASAATQYGCPGKKIASYSVTERNEGFNLSNVYLYYDGATGKNCVVNRRTGLGEFGTRARLEVHLWAVGGQSASDVGNFAEQAGPISISAPGRCIRVKAVVHTVSGYYGDLEFGGFCG